jgi:uncharacterized protein YecT (DUF1311 family)
MIRALLPSLLLLALAAPAMAQSANRCNGDGNQLELNQCAADDFARADAALNAVYQQIMTTLPAGSVAKANLRISQRQWIVQRDADLQAEFPLEAGENARVMYGSMYPMLVSGAKAELTRQRSAWLRATFIERAEGDL